MRIFVEIITSIVKMPIVNRQKGPLLPFPHVTAAELECDRVMHRLRKNILVWDKNNKTYNQKMPIMSMMDLMEAHFEET